SESKCCVGASVPRCRVVPSVTLGTGGINSPVCGAPVSIRGVGTEPLRAFGSNAAFPADKPVVLLRRAPTIDASPFPRQENAGMKKLQPQKMPPGNRYIT